MAQKEGEFLKARGGRGGWRSSATINARHGPEGDARGQAGPESRGGIRVGRSLGGRKSGDRDSCWPPLGPCSLGSTGSGPLTASSNYSSSQR